MPAVDNRRSRPGAFTLALRAVRHLRGLRVGEIAQRMGMARRTYEYFEAHARFDWVRVQAFAAAMSSDPAAVLLSVAISSPPFAARCANKALASLLVAELRDLDGHCALRCARERDRSDQLRSLASTSVRPSRRDRPSPG